MEAKDDAKYPMIYRKAPLSLTKNDFVQRMKSSIALKLRNPALEGFGQAYKSI